MQTQLVVADLSADGFASVYNYGANVDMLVDIVGYYTAGSGARFVPITPTRVIDTRYNVPGWGVGPITQPLAPNTNTAVQLTGLAGVPTTGVSTVMVNAIGGGTTSAGFLSFWASGDAQPGTIGMTYYPKENTSNAVLAKVGADGKMIVTNYPGTSVLVVDVVGYFTTAPDPPPTTTTTVAAGRPFAPTGAAAVAGHRQAAVSWQAAGGNGAPITGYRIVPSAACPSCQGLTVSGGATSTIVIGLHPGSTYSFTVVATNRVGDSDPSGPSGLVTLPAEVPTAPSNVQAMPGDGQANVSWNQSDPNGSTVTLYTVTASPGGATGTSPGGGTTNVVGLINGTAYTFAVVGNNGVGPSPASAPSNSVTPAGLPGAPSNVRATFGNHTATVTWDPADGHGSPILHYTVTGYPSGQTGGPVVSTPGPQTSATFNAIDNVTKYFFSVTATSATGDGPSAESAVGSLRDTADAYMNGTLASFLVARGTTATGPGAGPPPFEWSADGCSVYPLLGNRVFQFEASFHDSCLRHDFGYRNYGNGLKLEEDKATKDWIDAIFLHDMQNQCGSDTACQQEAQVFYDGVQLGGDSAFYG